MLEFGSDAIAWTVDACTLNNVFNAVQLAILLALLRWVRGDDARRSRRDSAP